MALFAPYSLHALRTSDQGSLKRRSRKQKTATETTHHHPFGQLKSRCCANTHGLWSWWIQMCVYISLRATSRMFAGVWSTKYTHLLFCNDTTLMAFKHSVWAVWILIMVIITPHVLIYNRCHSVPLALDPNQHWDSWKAALWQRLLLPSRKITHDDVLFLLQQFANDYTCVIDHSSAHK